MNAVRLCIALALSSLLVHFVFGWWAFAEDAATHAQTAEFGAYLVEWGRDTFENLQSEFWQLALQFAILAGALKAMGVEARQDDIDQLTEAVDDLRVDVKAVLLAQARGGRMRED